MLEKEYKHRRSEIRSRLLEFKRVGNSPKKIFEELCFCLCTPQSKARACDRVVKTLKKRGLLSGGDGEGISRVLMSGGVRFHNNKARYIVEARDIFPTVLERVRASRDMRELRRWLVKNVKGLGYKEASHFLRNIGMGEGLAILDRHILKELRKFGAVKNAPESLSGRRYLETEQRMLQFSKRMKIPMEELDLLLWSLETGEVFK